MVRMARLVVPDHPHHVVQRGNRRMKTFLCEADYQFYIKLMAKSCSEAGTQVWAYCLMPNHVHLIMVPQDTDGLRRTLSEAHRQYTRHVNLREDWRGHLWQERFHSFPMDESYLLACARYVELNPVRANLTHRFDHWRWSSAKAHLKGVDDALVKVKPLLDMAPDWRGFLKAGIKEDALEHFRKHSTTGRPLGPEQYVKALEAQTGRQLIRRKPGPKVHN